VHSTYFELYRMRTDRHWLHQKLAAFARARGLRHATATRSRVQLLSHLPGDWFISGGHWQNARGTPPPENSGRNLARAPRGAKA
jgi:hypothetical protein